MGFTHLELRRWYLELNMLHSRFTLFNNNSKWICSSVLCYWRFKKNLYFLFVLMHVCSTWLHSQCGFGTCIEHILIFSHFLLLLPPSLGLPSICKRSISLFLVTFYFAQYLDFGFLLSRNCVTLKFLCLVTFT